MVLAGVTDVVPTRRMSVARGNLLGAPTEFSPDALAAARVAATVAAKDAHRTLPTAPPFQLTDCLCEVAREGEAWVATVTCIAYARTTLETAALLGVAAALASLWDSAKGADVGAGPGMRIEGLHLVQNVEG